MKLTEHSQSYLIETLPFDRVELRLKEFVAHERNYLSTRTKEQLNNFTDESHEQELLKIISAYPSQTSSQVDNDRD